MFAPDFGKKATPSWMGHRSKARGCRPEKENVEFYPMTSVAIVSVLRRFSPSTARKRNVISRSAVIVTGLVMITGDVIGVELPWILEPTMYRKGPL